MLDNGYISGYGLATVALILHFGNAACSKVIVIIDNIIHETLAKIDK